MTEIQIEELITPYLKEHDVELYAIEFARQYGSDIVRIILDKKGGIDIDTLAAANHAIGEMLDRIDQDMGEYMLEVCSPGAEKILRNETEIINAIGQYVNIKTKDQVFEGELLSVESPNLVVRINIKGRFKNQEVCLEDIKKIRLAVKL